MKAELSVINNIISSVLPGLSGSNVTYIKERNMFLSHRYTSAAGNTYYQGLRLSDRIIVSLDLGQGYCRNFLNGLHIYCFDGHEKKLIGSEYYHCQFYSESFIKREATRMMQDFIESQARMMGISISTRQAEDTAEALIESISPKMNLIA